ncbi:protein kinase [Streptomyces sp. NPDC091219]|uniref:serine/threonine-protein kinase n=1 Tax=Streptomyces sp. NPDC091219 TaxID=3155193 RepID=UPI00344C8DDB
MDVPWDGAAVPSGDSERADGADRLLAGRYRVLARLGRGGMGVVWRALDEVLGREVAIKELRTFTDAHGPELADLRLRMQREARAAARIRHPGVVAVHDIAEVDGRPLIVMELIDGPSLDDVVGERGPIDPREAAGIGAKVMEALAAAHAVGVLHRDVKPGNILLDRSGRVVLTDFGIATMDDPGDGSTTHLTRSGELIGSLDYLAPERAQGADPGPSSDVWALGATLYAAVEGTSPFRRTSTYSTLTAIVSEPLPEPVRAGRLGPVLRQLMEKRPESRPDAERAREMLETVARGAGTDLPTAVLRGAHGVPNGGAAAARQSADPSRQPSAQAAGSPDADVPGREDTPPPGPPRNPRASAYPAETEVEPPGSSGEFGAAAHPQGPGSTAPSPAAPQGFGPPLAPAPHTFAPTGPLGPATPPRRRARVLIAAVAGAVVLVGAGVAYALHNAHENEAGTRPSVASAPASAVSSPTGHTDAGHSGSPRPTGQGKGRTPAPAGTRGGHSGATPSERGSASAPAEPTAGSTVRGANGGSGSGGSTGGSGSPGPAAACRAIGGGKYDCQVWRSATSYTASGAEAGVLGAGTNYFFCQRNLGRRETYGRWTNTWWAKTDDDSGNTNVYVSAVYLRGGDNDEPVPGLPVC